MESHSITIFKYWECTLTTRVGGIAFSNLIKTIDMSNDTKVATPRVAISKKRFNYLFGCFMCVVTFVIWCIGMFMLILSVQEDNSKLVLCYGAFTLNWTAFTGLTFWATPSKEES
jgi:hypothetical protein